MPSFSFLSVLKVFFLFETIWFGTIQEKDSWAVLTIFFYFVLIDESETRLIPLYLLVRWKCLHWSAHCHCTVHINRWQMKPRNRIPSPLCHVESTKIDWIQLVHLFGAKQGVKMKMSMFISHTPLHILVYLISLCLPPVWVHLLLWVCWENLLRGLITTVHPAALKK